MKFNRSKFNRSRFNRSTTGTISAVMRATFSAVANTFHNLNRLGAHLTVGTAGTAQMRLIQRFTAALTATSRGLTDISIVGQIRKIIHATKTAAFRIHKSGTAGIEVHKERDL